MIPPAQLRRAADCAYQIGLAYLEGFGTARSDATALEWIRIAAEWGSHRGQADYLAIASTLELAQDSTVSVSSAQAVMPVFWTAKAVSERGDSVAATFLSRHPRAKSICTSTIQKYRDTYTLQCWKEFEELIGLTREDLFGDSECTTLRSYFSVEDMSHIFKIGNGWSLLHYAVLSGQLSAVKFLVEKLDADVRCLSWHSETPLDIAIANGNSTMIDYLLDRHENARPHFKVGSCPLQNIAFLPANLIPDIVFRILSRSQPIGIDVRSEATARTALMNTMLIEAPLYPESRRTAAETLISFGANPLLTTAEAGTASPLLLVVQQLDCDLVKVMLNAISTNEHVIPLVDQARTRPEPCNELARSFFKLMQTPRSVRVTVGVTNYKNSYSEMVRLLMKEGIATELPYACRTSKHDPLGLACYYGNDEAAAAMLDISPEINSQFQNTLIGDPGLDALLTAVGCGFAETIDILLPRMMARNNVAEYNVLVSAVHHQPALIPKIYSHFERAGKGQKLLSYVDPWGATALDTALEYELMDLANFLLEKGATYDEYRLKGDHSIDEGKQFTFASVLPRMKPVKFLMELNPKPRLVVTESGLNVFHILALDEKLIGKSPLLSSG
jgi:ankyrin repeat protein